MQLKPEKLVQASAVLLRESNSRAMSYLRLIKLLYVAERESLSETGSPIIWDRIVAMKHGPVLSRSLDTIKGLSTHSQLWNQFILTEGYQVRLMADPGNGHLCRYEVRKLQDVSRRYSEKSDWEIVEELHQFPEWIKNNPGDSSQPIPLSDIFEAVGRKQEAAELAAEIEACAKLDEHLAKMAG